MTIFTISAHVALTGQREAYYTDYFGGPQEFISAVKYGYLYQGQRYKWQKKRRGTPALDLPPAHFVTFLDNHDQVANSGRGQRCHQLTSPGRYHAMTGLLLLGPATPMLFQGQEFAASAPFHYFADHNPELARLVRTGRHDFLKQFKTLALPDTQALLANPEDPGTFEASRLDWGELETHADAYALHRTCCGFGAKIPCCARSATGVWMARFLALTHSCCAFLASRTTIASCWSIWDEKFAYDPAPEPLLAPRQDKNG